MDSEERKTLYREDSLGGDHNRVRPRGYSFEDLIEEEEEIQHKVARTKEQVSSNAVNGARSQRRDDTRSLTLPSLNPQEFRRKAFNQGSELVESLQREEKVAVAAALAKQSETSTSQGVRFADEEAVDRNDSIETQPSLKASLGLDASVSTSFKFKGIVDEDVPSPHLNSAEKGKGSESGKGALEDIDIQAEGNDPQENEVIKLEERAPPIAEEEADPDPDEGVDVALVANSTGFVTLHIHVRGSENSAGNGIKLEKEPEPVQEKPKKRKKKKQDAAKQLEPRDPWNLGTTRLVNHAPTTGKASPTKAHKVFDSDKKLSYTKKKDLLLAHLRAVNTRHKEAQPTSPEPEAKRTWKRAAKKASIISTVNDSYLAALDSARRAKQLSAARLTPEREKAIPKVMDPNSDYKKRYGRLSPSGRLRSAAKRVKAANADEGASAFAEVVSLKLTDIFAAPSPSPPKPSPPKEESKRKKVEASPKAKAYKSKPRSIPRKSPRSPSESSLRQKPASSPPPVEMSFKLSEITSTFTSTTRAIQKFKSFKTPDSAKDANGDVGESPSSVKDAGESSSGEGLVQPKAKAEVSRAVHESSQDGGDVEMDEETTTSTVSKEDEEDPSDIASAPKPDQSRPTEMEIEEVEEDSVSREAAKSETEASPKGKSISLGASDVDPKIVDYFMQIDEEEDKKTKKKKSKKKKKKKKSKLKRFFGKMICQSKPKM